MTVKMHRMEDVISKRLIPNNQRTPINQLEKDKPVVEFKV